jgi:uncharacterized damage-inducible protein DinB
MLAGEENLGGPQFREKMGKLAPLPTNCSAPELRRELRSSIEARIPELASRSPEFYAGIVTRADGAKVTRLELLQFVKEHELIHRSQLFMYLRMKGIVPSTTRRRQAAQAAR